MTRLRDRKLTTIDMMSKRKTIREKLLAHPVKKWPWKSREKFYRWVKETYGDVDNPEKYTDGYRAWKQLVWSTDSQIYKQPTQILTSASMVKMAQEILNNSMREAYEEHGIL